MALLVLAACAADGDDAVRGGEDDIRAQPPGSVASAAGDAGTDASAATDPKAQPPTGRCSDARASKTVTVKVMDINVRHDADEWERRFELIADEIARLDPDLIGLQEVKMRVDQSVRLNDLVKKRGHAAYHVHEKMRPGVLGFFTGEGVAVMSRWPIAKKLDVELDENRATVVARIEHPSGGVIDMASMHLEHRSGDEFDAIRLKQVEDSLSFMKNNDACAPTFVTGDMNSGESATSLKKLFSSGFVDSYRAVHGDATPKTGNTAMVVLRDGAFEQAPKRRIDFVLARDAGERTAKPQSSVVCFKNHDAKGFYPSDHFGIMTTYEVRLD